MNFFMTGQQKGDLLTQVTSWACLTVLGNLIAISEGGRLNRSGIARVDSFTQHRFLRYTVIRDLFSKSECNFSCSYTIIIHMHNLFMAPIILIADI